MHPVHCYAYRRNSFESMVHIGALIQEKMKEKRLSAAAFATLINTDRNNVYNIFRRQSMDTELLYSISIVLEYDFFLHFKPLENIQISTVASTETFIDGNWLQAQFKLLHDKIDTLQKPK